MIYLGYCEHNAYAGKWTVKDPILFEGGNSDPVNLVDPWGLDTKICSRKLGDKKGPDRSIYNPLSHQYLVVNGIVYSFQAGDSMIWSQSRIEIGKNSVEDPNRKSCVTISTDSCYDKSVLKAIDLIGATKYNVWAYPGTFTYSRGARNCQSWARDVLYRAVEIYRKNCK